MHLEADCVQKIVAFHTRYAFGSWEWHSPPHKMSKIQTFMWRWLKLLSVKHPEPACLCSLHLTLSNVWVYCEHHCEPPAGPGGGRCRRAVAAAQLLRLWETAAAGQFVPNLQRLLHCSLGSLDSLMG